MTSAGEDFGSHRRRGDGRREPAHAKTSPRWPDAAPPAYQDPGPTAYQADYYQAEYPGWTQSPGYQAEYGEIPGWAGQRQAEYPEWSGQPAYQARPPGWSDQRGYQGEYPGWAQLPVHPDGYSGWAQPPAAQGEYPGQPGPYGQYALHPDHPSWPESQFAPWPGEAPGTDRRPSARDMDFYPAPIMQDTITDVANWAQPDAGYAQPARERIWDAGSSQLADWIIEDANEQAAEIFRQARSQASSSLADAQQEAAELVRRTGEQARLTIEAAELEAAEIRATMMKLTTDLTGMAAYVTQILTPAPSARPAAAPGPHRAPPRRPGPPPSPRTHLNQVSTEISQLVCSHSI